MIGPAVKEGEARLVEPNFCRLDWGPVTADVLLLVHSPPEDHHPSLIAAGLPPFQCSHSSLNKTPSLLIYPPPSVCSQEEG
ncbi:hypothetical protein F2P79_003358 [Pimephales promelas]|nr:hypothetical protein F2P79_003358 [Pimephales promelas]